MAGKENSSPPVDTSPPGTVLLGNIRGYTGNSIWGSEPRHEPRFATLARKTKRADCQWQTALRQINFRSYDNPHTICQNLPESTVTSAEAEEGWREELEACIPAAREGLGMQCVA